MNQSNIDKLNDVCVFCFKTIRESVQLGNNDGPQTVDKFCKFLRRINAKRFNVLGSSTKLLPTCEACDSIMVSFNELYYQIQCLQLQMEYRLDKLKNVMKCADKVPSRVKEFHKRYVVPNGMQSNRTLHGEEYKHLLCIRNFIKLQMTEYLSNMIPHVRLQNHTPNSKQCDNTRPQLQPPSKKRRLNFDSTSLLEWLKTVIAVTMCSFPIGHYNRSAPLSIPEALKNSSKRVCVSSVVSAPGSVFNVNSTTREVSEETECPKQISLPSPSSPDNFEDAVTNSSVSGSVLGDEYLMKVEDEQLNKDECTPSNTPVSIDYQLSSDSVDKIITVEIIKSKKLGRRKNSHELIDDDVTPKFESQIQSPMRQLRSKYKCKSCSLTFSTSTRLNEHAKTCTSGNDDSSSEDEVDFEDDIGATMSDNDYMSENKFKKPKLMEEDSDSDCSEKQQRNTKNNGKNTKSLLETSSWSLDQCLEMYKNSNGRTPLSEKSVSILKLTAIDIQLKGFEFLETCKSPGCESLLFSIDDLEYHRDLHGQFKCHFCELTLDFATNLIEHELGHNSYLKNGLCPRCPKVKVDAVSYKKHFLEHHLETSVKYRCAQCPVCSMSFPETDQVPLSHFVNEHDVSRLNDREKVFSCNENNCPAYFLTFKQFLCHSKVIHNKTKRMFCGKLVECSISCDICPLKFSLMHQLTLHKKLKHKIDPGLAVITEDGLTINEILDDRNALFPCLVTHCTQKFWTKKDRDAHSNHHDSFKCNICSVETTFAPDMAIHELEHDNSLNIIHSLPKASYKCRQCAFSASNKSRYVDHHVLNHLNLSPDTATIKCPICNNSFIAPLCEIAKVKISLFRHFLTHHDKSEVTNPATLFNCAHCPAYFLLENQMHLHDKRMHPEHVSTLSFPCADCDEQFQLRPELLSHRTTVHHNQDESGYEFICQVDYCNERFEYECDLDRHIAWHKKYTEKSCSERGNRVTQGGFHLPIKSHQKHVCEQCGKSFTQKHHFARHLLYHAGPESWQFMCDICSLKCPTKDRLMSHKIIHFKIKPFNCETCGATFTRRYTWRQHLVKKHGVPDFK